MKKETFFNNAKKMAAVWAVIWIADIIIRWIFPFYTYYGDAPQPGTNFAILHWSLFDGEYKQATFVYLISFIARCACIAMSIIPINKKAIMSFFRIILVVIVAFIDFLAMRINGYHLWNTTWAFWTEMGLLFVACVFSVISIIKQNSQKKAERISG